MPQEATIAIQEKTDEQENSAGSSVLYTSRHYLQALTLTAPSSVIPSRSAGGTRLETLAGADAGRWLGGCEEPTRKSSRYRSRFCSA